MNAVIRRLSCWLTPGTSRLVQAGASAGALAVPKVSPVRASWISTGSYVSSTTAICRPSGDQVRA